MSEASLSGVGAAGEGPELSVVVCTLDEAAAIGGVLEELGRALDGVHNEVIVVDDGSTDGTPDIVGDRAAADPRVRLVRRAHERGLASAAIAGWDIAHGRLLAVMDGDGQHDPAVLRAMLGRAEGADVVVASRYLGAGDTGLTGRRDLLSRLGTRAAALALRAPVTDPLSGCFLMRREWYAAARPRLSGVGFKILIDLLGSSPRPPRVAEVPTALRPRAGGESKLDARVVADAAALLIEKRTRGLFRARFVLFTAVGLSGVVVHMSALSLAVSAHAPFWAGQAAAILAAMTWNFILNNRLTFRDRRLHGSAFLRGLLSFYVACALGAVVNQGVATGAHTLGAPWGLAGLAGALSGGLWNFFAARRATWGAETRPPRPGSARRSPRASGGRT